MQIVVAGVSHRQAPLELRERLAVPDAALEAELSALRRRVSEGFMLSTCHRVEVYALCGHESSGADLLRAFLLRNEQDTDAARQAVYVHAGESAVRHALRVASGLDSMVLGEQQIQAQFRRALAVARRAGTLGPTLARLGDAALACGKRVRASTSLGRHAVSLATLAVQAAAERTGTAGRRVLVMGAGEIAALVLRHLRPAAVDGVEIVSRSLARARALAARSGGRAIPWTELTGGLERADIVFSCTTASGVLVTREMLADRQAATGGRAILLMDLGLPRDVDVRASALPGVSILHFDELSAAAAAHEQRHHGDLSRAEDIVDGEAIRYVEWLSARAVAAAIGRVHAHGEAVAEAELARALARLPDLSPHDRRVVRDLAQRIVGKLLHQPTLTLKQHPEVENLVLALEVLLGVPGALAKLEERLPRAGCDGEGEPVADDSAA